MKQKVLAFVVRYRKWLIAAAVAVVAAPIAAMLLAYVIIEPYKKDIVSIQDVRHQHVGMVLGAGVTKNGRPYKELQARLDVAAQAYDAGKVDKLLLSGDNSTKSYDEPTAMFNYLVQQKHIPAANLQRDYAGRDTYQSCWRAANVFGQHDIIIFSASSHLTRAMFLCQHLGIRSQGVSSGVEASNSFRREALARVKAILNIYVLAQKPLTGPPVKM